MANNEHKALLERRDNEMQRLKASYDARRKQLDQQMEVELERLRRGYEQREASLLRSQRHAQDSSPKTVH